MVYIVERFLLQTICVQKKEILQFLGLKTPAYNWGWAVNNQEQVIMARVRYFNVDYLLLSVLYKVQVFWEGHKNWKKSPPFVLNKGGSVEETKIELSFPVALCLHF